MNKREAERLAKAAIKCVGIGEPEPVADATVLFKNEDGTFSVVDNGEEVVCRSATEAERIIVENLTA